MQPSSRGPSPSSNSRVGLTTMLPICNRSIALSMSKTTSWRHTTWEMSTVQWLCIAGEASVCSAQCLLQNDLCVTMPRQRLNADWGTHRCLHKPLSCEHLWDWKSGASAFSAGMGRTGTFMAAVFLLDRLRKNPQNVDIVGTVLAMRKWRANLVQVWVRRISSVHSIVAPPCMLSPFFSHSTL